jgi:hypothetical protein
VAGTDVHRTAREQDPVALFKKIMPCPSCGNRLHLVPELVGYQIRCKVCRSVLRVTEGLWRRPGTRPATGPAEQPPRERREGPIPKSLGLIGATGRNGEIDEEEVLEILGEGLGGSGRLGSAALAVRPNGRPVLAQGVDESPLPAGGGGEATSQAVVEREAHSPHEPEPTPET